MNAFIAVSDDRAREAMRALAGVGVTAGETGASGLAGLLELLTGAGHEQHRADLELDENSRVLVFITEGATDPVSYAQIVR
jgi:diaminopropionate ammonia-lyase